MENEIKSSIEYAYDVLKEEYEKKQKSEPMKFTELMLAVAQKMNVTDEKALLKMASRFYTDLILDGRFVLEGDNTWVLREYVEYAKIHIDMNEVYTLEKMNDDRDNDEQIAKKAAENGKSDEEEGSEEEGESEENDSDNYSDDAYEDSESKNSDEE